jgi:hypothetical protein
MSNEGKRQAIALYDAIERAIANVQPALGKIGARTHRRLRSPTLDAANKILALAIAGGNQPITAKKAGKLVLANRSDPACAYLDQDSASSSASPRCAG